jgi:integrase/recombinase XerD
MHEVHIKKLVSELKIRGFSLQTIKAYSRFNAEFLDFIKKPPSKVLESDVKEFLGYLISDKGLSSKSVALARSSLLFFYNEVLEKNFSKIKTPKIERKAPDILSKKEIKELIGATKNKRDQILIKLLYSTGMRVSECVNVKVGDLDLDEKICSVRQGKGKKDRITILSASLASDIRSYLFSEGIFQGFIFDNGRGKPLSTRFVQQVVSNAAKTAGLLKQVTPHKLRHSFATHLLDSGVSIRIIQELLGHSNLQTTQIYTQVSREQIKRIKNPLDDI